MKTGFVDFIEQQRRDEEHMRAALAAAEAARHFDNPPIGAVLASGRTTIAESSTVWSERNALATAEINVLNKAHEFGLAGMRHWVLYSTVEPSALSVLAAAEHGIREVVFGAYDHQNGFLSAGLLNVNKLGISYRGGVLAAECREVLPSRLREHTGETFEPL